MKKALPWINVIFLVVNIALFLFFVIYTVLGVKPFGSYITDKFVETEFIIALFYELVYFAAAFIISKLAKKDLSYKGPDVLNFVPKPVVWTVILIGFAGIIYTVITKISFEFAIMVIFMAFTILLQIGNTVYFFKSQSK